MCKHLTKVILPIATLPIKWFCNSTKVLEYDCFSFNSSYDGGKNPQCMFHVLL